VSFKSFITNSVSEKSGEDRILTQPFLLNTGTVKQPSFFEAKFLLGKTVYRYGYEVTEKAVVKEWLFESKSKKEYPVFLRIGNNFEIEKKRFPNSSGLEQKTRTDALFLSVASQWNQAKAIEIVNWYSGIFALHGLYDSHYKNYTIELLKNESYAKIIGEFIQKADLGISNMQVLDIKLKDIESSDKLNKRHKELYREQYKGDYKTVMTFHDLYNEKSTIVGQEPFFLDTHESAGTQKYFNLIGILIFAIYNNRLVIIDELDAGLHSLLARSILKLFNNRNLKTNAQLLVATHDTTLLDKEILRRDQIYFTEKDQYGATKVTALVEYKPRKDAPYDKNYLEGKFGAIPMIEDLADIFNHG
jgi:AAA15 family ATPase/GTPase